MIAMCKRKQKAFTAGKAILRLKMQNPKSCKHIYSFDILSTWQKLCKHQLGFITKNLTKKVEMFSDFLCSYQDLTCITDFVCRISFYQQQTETDICVTIFKIILWLLTLVMSNREQQKCMSACIYYDFEMLQMSAFFITTEYIFCTSAEVQSTWEPWPINMTSRR